MEKVRRMQRKQEMQENKNRTVQQNGEWMNERQEEKKWSMECKEGKKRGKHMLNANLTVWRRH